MQVSFDAGEVAQKIPLRRPWTTAWLSSERYEVGKLIGKGSYGTVRAAYDLQEERHVAIKMIPHLFDDLDDCKRNLREIAILSKLNHENIVRLHDIVAPAQLDSFNEIHIVLELVYTDMREVLRRPKLMVVRHPDGLLRDLLAGCAYIHSVGVYHRDLKPANCLLTRDWLVKICDFGLARAIGEGLPPLHYQDSMGVLDDCKDDHQDSEGLPPPLTLKRSLTEHVVTRWYRAPEIMLQASYTQAIDIWSVGCIYAELLAMLRPTRVEDRRPLFPGSSCLMLSPLYNQDLQIEGRDQLDMIFDLLGTPSAADVAALRLEQVARKCLALFPEREGTGLGTRFEFASAEQRDILWRMLRFNPQQRISAAEALEHTVFEDAGYRMEGVSGNTQSNQPIMLDFEERKLDDAALRQCFEKLIQDLGSEHRCIPPLVPL